MDKMCPICKSEMALLSSGSEIPSVPFIKIPVWIKQVEAYKCQKCQFIGLWYKQ